MSVPRIQPRGRPFKPGNSGRPPGSKNKVTRALEQLAEGQAEQLTQKLLELALAGDVTCLRIALDRIWPVRKGQPLQVDLPPIETADDLRAGFASLLNGIGEGRLTADEVNALCAVLDRAIRIVEIGGLDKRVEALERKLEPSK